MKREHDEQPDSRLAKAVVCQIGVLLWMGVMLSSAGTDRTFASQPDVAVVAPNQTESKRQSGTPANDTDQDNDQGETARTEVPRGRVLIRAQRIVPIEGEAFGPGVILVESGKIKFVGDSIELALPADEVNANTVMPGLIDAYSQAGLAGRDAELAEEVTPEFPVVRAVDWRSRDFKELRDEGVTTVHLVPATEGVFPGLSAIVKTAGPPSKRVTSPQQHVVTAVCSDPTAGNRSRTRPDSVYVRQPTNRMGVVWIIRSALHQALPGTQAVTLQPQTADVLGRVLTGELPVLSVSRQDYDIRSALSLGREFGYTPLICGGDEAYRMLDELAESGSGVIYTAVTDLASSRGLRGEEGTDLRWNVPGKLASANIAFCLAGGKLLDQVRFSVRYGLERQLALRSVTLSAAKLLELDEQLGSIRVGKAADLIGLDGDPLHPASAVKWTMVGGKLAE